jgi:hypothetical protein
MADSTKIDVYAMTPGHTFSIPISMGLPNNNIRAINPVREESGLWIGKMKPEPENADLINCEIVVGRDKVTSDYQYYYTDLTVIEAISLINSGTVPTSLRLSFTSLEAADSFVGDAYSLAGWNTFFDLPANGTPFTSLSVLESGVHLYGGADITLKPNIFQAAPLTAIIDEGGVIIDAGNNNSFVSNVYLTIIDLPAVTVIGNNFANSCFILTTVNLPLLETMNGDFQFAGCSSVAVFDFPLLQNVGQVCFAACDTAEVFNLPSCVDLGGSVLNNSVFVAIAGNAITLTVPALLMTCNGGLPDGDIQYLQANNTVTIVIIPNPVQYIITETGGFTITTENNDPIITEN